MLTAWIMSEHNVACSELKILCCAYVLMVTSPSTLTHCDATDLTDLLSPLSSALQLLPSTALQHPSAFCSAYSTASPRGHRCRQVKPAFCRRLSLLLSGGPSLSAGLPLSCPVSAPAAIARRFALNLRLSALFMAPSSAGEEGSSTSSCLKASGSATQICNQEYAKCGVFFLCRAAVLISSICCCCNCRKVESVPLSAPHSTLLCCGRKALAQHRMPRPPNLRSRYSNEEFVT